jgi:hypothetical protein
MKNIKIAVAMLTVISAFAVQIRVNAQESATSNTLLGSGKLIDKEALGFFVAPAYGFTQMDGSNAHLFHVRAGATFKDRWALGAFYNVSMNEIRPVSELLNNVYMDYWALGGFLEFTAWSKKLAHVSFPLYVGMGEVEMDNEAGEARLGEANFFQIEPSALLELNLHKYVRFNLGAGYRIVGDMTYRNFNQSDISGITGYVGLKFGLFD